MPLSWNEIRANALAFGREWAAEAREHAEAKTFWDELFRVFGLTRRHVASFEEPVKNLRGHYSFIDLFWRGMLLAEHKSRGKDLGKAHAQAIGYIQDLQREGRDREIPRYVIVSDFARLALHDMEEGHSIEFPVADLHQNVQHFAFIAGYQQHRLQEDDPINLDAVRIMGDLHDALEADGYRGHALERMLVRILFCLFSEDTGIFERNAFELFIRNHTLEDGSDLGAQLARFFHILNTPEENRQANLVEELAQLPYVNGDLFAESLGFAEFNRDMRDRLLAATLFDWSRISPAVFGALFQAVMEPAQRRQIGAHYTSERDILKVLRPLFLDAMQEELRRAGVDRAKLDSLHAKIASLRLLDPACGCGNFLVVAYRELRLIEIEILRRLHRAARTLDIKIFSRVDVDQMYGIEIEEWPARIAEVALWLVDHQMNLKLSETFGQYFVRLPLLKSPHIAIGNALRMDWNDLLPAEQCSYVLGNPPFVGAKYQNPQQKADIASVVAEVQNGGLLDYVTAWYFKAAAFTESSRSPIAFVSTNSISQGEQAGVLWNALLKQHPDLSIHFAHRTFAWESEARGKAHVHVVIVGFGHLAAKKRRLFDYELSQEEPSVAEVSNISPYLVEGPNFAIVNRSRPLCDVPSIGIGNKPIDAGMYLFTDEQKAAFLNEEPRAAEFFRPWYGAIEFINRRPRWCLWLGDCPPERIRSMPAVHERVEAVRRYRLASKSAPTRKLAETPTRFHVENMPKRRYLLIPKVSSERRRFIPMAFMKPRMLASDLVFIFPNATLYHFGILTSTMHMAWVRTVAGRLKSDYRYSAKLAYNNFPWPQSPKPKQIEAVEQAAQAVLDAREEFPSATLADLYDPLVMPASLVRAHRKLDQAVDRCYRARKFDSERKRVELLFTLYEKLAEPLLGKRAAGR